MNKKKENLYEKENPFGNHNCEKNKNFSIKIT